MKITSLGYSPVNQSGKNYKSSTTPAFKGKISVEGLEHDAGMLDNTLPQIGHLVKYYACLLCKGFKNSEVVGEGNTLRFPKKVDEAAQIASDSLGGAYAKHKVNIKLIFEPSAE